VPVERFTRARLAAAPWKNGGGLTREIVCRPAGSDMDRFDWRVSIAEVSADGAFSVFDGIDRVIMLLEGNGVELRSADGSIDRRLSEPLAPFAFSGDASISASLIDGPSSDFNVMTRRATTCSAIQILGMPGKVAPAPGGVLLAMRGAWRVQEASDGDGNVVEHLQPGEGLWWHDEPREWNVATSDAGAALIAVRISARVQ
jgi:environmental stress-induced protein Ves